MRSSGVVNFGVGCALLDFAISFSPLIFLLIPISIEKHNNRMAGRQGSRQMKIEFGHFDLDPLIRRVAAESVAEFGREQDPLGKLAYTEGEAAGPLRMQVWPLRDECSDGRIAASVGRGNRIPLSRFDPSLAFVIGVGAQLCN
jgi:hypothetical protein